MNVFEDLIGALKEENLLEETVVKVHQSNDNDARAKLQNGNPELAYASAENNLSAAERQSDFLNELPGAQHLPVPEYLKQFVAQNNAGDAKPGPEALKIEERQYFETASTADTFGSEKALIDEKAFYRKRAIEEVSGLQMVEHVLSGVEREQNKTAAAYNNITVNKALHDFLQIAEDATSTEHAQSEFRLMQETETWCSALSHRDKNISVANLRRFFETTKPPLSSQALISLARFYRNLPYTESVRSKFDLVVTRLFSKDIGGDKRLLVFTREELIRHTAELYAEWSSIPLYSAGEDESIIAQTALKFEEFITEAERAESFDELVNKDFFNRLRLFKEKTDEVFFAPLITATAIESNIRIGNKFVDLIELEREKSGPETLQEKYCLLNEQEISDSTGKTLQLIGILQGIAEQAPAAQPKAFERKTVSEKHTAARKAESSAASSQLKRVKKQKRNLFEVNKWLLAATLISVFLSSGLYVWVNFTDEAADVSTDVRNINLENSIVKEHVQTARVSNDTFYGITTPSWDALAPEKKEEIIKRIFASGKEKGFLKVHLLNNQGKAVGFAAGDKVEVITP
jgi:hypothetical protein